MKICQKKLLDPTDIIKHVFHKSVALISEKSADFYLKKSVVVGGLFTPYDFSTISQRFLNDFSVVGSLWKSVGIVVWCELGFTVLRHGLPCMYPLDTTLVRYPRRHVPPGHITPGQIPHREIRLAQISNMYVQDIH